MPRTRTTPDVTLDQIRNRATIPVWHTSEPSAAGVFGVGRATAYVMAERGDIPSMRIGGRVVVPVPALLRILGEVPPLIGTQGEPAGQQGCSHADEPAPSHSRSA